MTKTCVICKKEPVPGDFSRSFHKFPKNSDLKQKWMEVIGIQNISKVSTVCSDHFDGDAYHQTNGYTKTRRLLSTAVPVVFGNNTVLKQMSNMIQSSIEDTCSDIDDSISNSLNSLRDTSAVSDFSTEVTSESIDKSNGSQDLVPGIGGNTELLPQPKSIETNDNLDMNSKRQPSGYPTLCIMPLSVKPNDINFINNDNVTNLSIVKQETDTETVCIKAPESELPENYNIKLENELCNVNEENLDTNFVKIKVVKSDDSGQIHEYTYNVPITHYVQNNTNVKEGNIETEKPVTQNIIEITQECADLGVDYIGINENSELDFKNTVGIQDDDENQVANQNNVFSQTFPNCDTQQQIEIQNSDNTNPTKDSTTHKCNDCHKEFKWQSTLKVHMKVHTGEKPFECPKCHLKFTRSGGLKLHLMRHEGLKPFKCNSCDSAFVLKRELEEHFNSKHSGNKPFKCENCGKAFATNNSLSQHKIIHRDKTFACEVCPLRYNAAYNLRRHMKVHERSVRDSCENCGRVCGNSGSLMRHVKVCMRKSYS